MILIEHQMTADMPDNQPLPPFLDDNAVWHVVRRFPNQKTLWRRIRLQNAHEFSAASSRAFFYRRQNP